MFRWLPGLALSILLSACVPVTAGSTSTAIPTSSTITSTATPTIVWFPATATPTPAPTLASTPTPVMNPGQGEVILTDDFTNPTQWTTGSSAAGNVAYGAGELTLAVAQPKGFLYSLRASPVLTDFYLDISFFPSLCQGNDAFGLLLRLSPELSGYRFSVTCNGLLRLERINRYESVVLVDWFPSGQIPPGTPGAVRLGVWAYKKEMRFFVNGVYQFTFSDPMLLSGSIGAFARAAGDTAVTASLSNLTVWGLISSQIPPPTPQQPTLTPTKRP